MRCCFRKLFPVLLAFLLLCGMLAFAAAEEEQLPAYTGKMTQEDTFTEDTLNNTNWLSSTFFYRYDETRPEWKTESNVYYGFPAVLTSGEKLSKYTVEQLSGPDNPDGFKFEKLGNDYIGLELSKIQAAEPGVYRFLATVEGKTCYARTAFSIEVKEQPEELVPLQTRSAIFLTSLDPVENPEKLAVISSPEDANTYLAIYDPQYKYYTTYRDAADSKKPQNNYLYTWKEGVGVFQPLQEYVYDGEIYSRMGMLTQEIPCKVIVSSTLTYDDFALTLTPETLQAAGGQKVKIDAAFANPDQINAKAKNDGIDWSVTTASGEDASAFATLAKGVLTVKKLTEPQDLVVTAASQYVKEQSASVTIHAVPLTSGLTAAADKDTLYLAEGADQAQITVTAEPAAAVPAVTFKSSADKVATVSEDGKVTAVGAGKVTITVTAGDGSKKSAKVALNVVAPVTGLTLSAAQEQVAPGKSVKIKAALEPEKPTDKTLSYAIGTADEGLADYLKVSKDGTVSVAKGCPAGKFTVVATANGAAPAAPVSAEITFTVSE